MRPQICKSDCSDIEISPAPRDLVRAGFFGKPAQKSGDLFELFQCGDAFCEMRNATHNCAKLSPCIIGAAINQRRGKMAKPRPAVFRRELAPGRESPAKTVRYLSRRVFPLPIASVPLGMLSLRRLLASSAKLNSSAFLPTPRSVCKSSGIGSRI